MSIAGALLHDGAQHAQFGTCGMLVGVVFLAGMVSRLHELEDKAMGRTLP